MARWEIRKGGKILSRYTSLEEARKEFVGMLSKWNHTHKIPADWRDYRIHEILEVKSEE